MATPKSVLWPLQRHTQAKHEVLVRYIDAWLPILSKRWDHLLVVDGFAGPGRYEGGEPGSPLLLLDAHVERHPSLPATPHFLFIERNKARLDHLSSEISRDNKYANEVTELIHGDFSEEFPDAFDRYRRDYPGIPVFAFIDPFGAGDGAAELTSKLIQLPRCEALMYVPLNFLARHIDSHDMATTLDRLYGDRRWEKARSCDSLAGKRAELQRALSLKMQASCKFVRWFDIVPGAGGNTYSLFFGTNHELGLQKMKEAMWKVDPASGSKFRDSTLVDHPVLFAPSADSEELVRLLHKQFRNKKFSIDDASRFTLLETPFRNDGHLKPALKAAERSDRLKVIHAKPNRRRGTFPDGTTMRFV